MLDICVLVVGIPLEEFPSTNSACRIRDRYLAAPREAKTWRFWAAPL